MNSPVSPARPVEDIANAASRIAGVVLVRVLGGAATEAVIARDVRALLESPPPDDIWRSQVSRLLVALGSAGQVTRDEFGLKLTAEGHAAVTAFLGERGEQPQGWPALRDGPLLAKALGIRLSKSRYKALAKVDGLRMLIVEQHWKLKLKGKPSASRLRQALALTALERAFGNQVKNEVGAKSGLSPKASRLLAGQLAKKPRDFKTDARLIAALAAEAVGATKSDLSALRTGALKRFLGALPGARPPQPASTSPPAVRVPTGVAQPAPARASASVMQPHLAPQQSAPPSLPVADLNQRPNPQTFARAVKSAAASRAEGWPGNRRAYIAQAFDAVVERHSGWKLTEIEFKAMLIELHRMGLVSLMTADLKDKSRLADIDRSAVTYKNTIWHYVRVDD